MKEEQSKVTKQKGDKAAKEKSDKATKEKSQRKAGAPTRLWVKAAFLGFRRSKVHQNENQALLRLQNVNDKHDTRFYWGKRVAYIYKAHNLNKQNTK
jgi:large subunit ribosomal protein L35Ae